MMIFIAVVFFFLFLMPILQLREIEASLKRIEILLTQVVPDKNR